MDRGLRDIPAPRILRPGMRCLLLLLPLLALPAWGSAQERNRAGLVIVKGDGSVQTACVAFDEPTISGLALLERAGLPIAVQPAGSNATVCSIAGEGCAFPREACWCQCAGGAPCRYWSYWHRNGGAWQYSATGAPLYRVPPGGVDAWVWGENTAGAASRPPEVAFEAICPVPAPARAPVLPTVRPKVPAPSATAPRPARPAATATKRPAARATATRATPTRPPATRTSVPRPKATATRPRSQATPTRPRSTARMPVPTPSPNIQQDQAPAGAAPRAVSTPTMSPSPTSAAGELPTTRTPESRAPAQAPGSANYVLFGGTAGVLLLTVALAWRRRR